MSTAFLNFKSRNLDSDEFYEPFSGQIQLVDTVNASAKLKEYFRSQDRMVSIVDHQLDQYTLSDIENILAFSMDEAVLSGDNLQVSWSRESSSGSVPIYWQPSVGQSTVELFEMGVTPVLYRTIDKGSIDEITVTTGALHDLCATIADLLSKGDIETIGSLCSDRLNESVRVVFSEDLYEHRFQTTPQDGVVSVLEPSDSDFTIHLSTETEHRLQPMAILHCLGHILCGHVQKGDSFAHWDNRESIIYSKSRQYRDKEVYTRFASLFKREVDDLTVKERAQVSMISVMNEKLGSSLTLHRKAQQYQQTKYQRVAAQRLVSLLESLFGGMLCDGVGLGKTYVATTIMVHYLNQWLDDTNPHKLPYRITVLSPHSVVSTWKNEAIISMMPFASVDWNQTVRVMSHNVLSGVSPNSEVLKPTDGGLSDLEHLLLSDLVIVDEAHNFRSASARRTKALRKLLSIQPHFDEQQNRRVLLLTATPINNSMEDFRQQLSLMYTRSDKLGFDGFNISSREATERIQQALQQRFADARASDPKGVKDVLPFILLGAWDGKFSEAFSFRPKSYVKRGPLEDYLKEQRDILDNFRREYKNNPNIPPVSVASELLNNVIVQRSREICKQIEATNDANNDLLFRNSSNNTTSLRYQDEFGGTEKLLEGFLPLFGSGLSDEEDEEPSGTSLEQSALSPLSLKVYMWSALIKGERTIDEDSSVVGLQKVLILKRLESSPVSFLLTLLRLLVLHAHRLNEIIDLAKEMHLVDETTTLYKEIEGLVKPISDDILQQLYRLTTGLSDRTSDSLRTNFISHLARAHDNKKSAAATDDEFVLPKQRSLFKVEDIEDDRWERISPLKEYLLSDFATLLTVLPDLMKVVFRDLEYQQWPLRFIRGGVEGHAGIEWPKRRIWGLRLITDAKLKALFTKVLEAHSKRQKTIIFSQFGDSIGYIFSVLKAIQICSENGTFSDTDWKALIKAFQNEYTKKEILHMIDRSAALTGAIKERDSWVNRFAPFYRIGPHRPEGQPTGIDGRTEWERKWVQAIEEPIDVLITSDILAEGVNLQDAAVLINFDLHWNPVKMIQRAGRIDRRLKRNIETPQVFQDLQTVCTKENLEVPLYYWHHHESESPTICNLLLPDVLESKLLLRERIALKTISIDITLGLEQGTGAEADWMQDYKYQGVQTLNQTNQDRPIEVLDSHRTTFISTLMNHGVNALEILAAVDKDSRFLWRNKWFVVGEREEDVSLVSVRNFTTMDSSNSIRVLKSTQHKANEWVLLKPGSSVLYAGWIPLFSRKSSTEAEKKPYHTFNLANPSVEASIEQLNELVYKLENRDVVEIDLNSVIPSQNGMRYKFPFYRWAYAGAALGLNTNEEKDWFRRFKFQNRAFLFQF